ncbi:MAG: hypothetical protein GPOALKHO_000382 [Sodalis sp.]|nr:MAG: hypothetical protein GPOALKHO_000382 [Sodalis sp.]
MRNLLATIHTERPSAMLRAAMQLMMITVCHFGINYPRQWVFPISESILGIDS